MHPAIVKGNTAVITGSGGGIGFAVAKLLASSGLNVVIADKNLQLLEAAKKSLQEISSAKILAIETDVSDKSSMNNLRDKALGEFSEVQFLHLNAGIGGKTSFSDPSTHPHFAEIFSVNVNGVLNGIQSFLPHMMKNSKASAIVCTGSKQGLTFPPGNPAYNASKAVVRSYTESLAHEMREIKAPISVHLLIPGWTFTGMTRRTSAEKPAGAWHASQVAEKLLHDMSNDKFYILCPDNQVDEATDHKRILYGANDIVKNRSALSRWDPKYEQEFKSWMS